jgi:hypothetical protein
MPQAEVAIVHGSHGGFNRIGELNDRIVAFIKARAAGKQAGSGVMEADVARFAVDGGPGSL